MTNLEIFLLTVFTVSVVWQAWIFFAAAQYIRAGYRNVKYGILPGIVAVASGVAMLVVTR